MEGWGGWVSNSFQGEVTHVLTQKTERMKGGWLVGAAIDESGDVSRWTAEAPPGTVSERPPLGGRGRTEQGHRVEEAFPHQGVELLCPRELSIRAVKRDGLATARRRPHTHRKLCPSPPFGRTGGGVHWH